MRSFDSLRSLRMKIGLIANFQFTTFFLIVNILLLISQIPMFMRIAHTPQDRVYPFVHTDWAHDYYLYLSAINQGLNGDWLYHDPYTTEKTPQGIFYIFFTTAGQIGRLFHLTPIVTYHLLTLISFEMFMISIFLLSRTIFSIATIIKQPKMPFLSFSAVDASPSTALRVNERFDTTQPKIPISKTSRPEITSDQVKIRYLEEDNGNLNKVGVSKKLGIEDANRWQDPHRITEKHGIEDVSQTAFWAILFAILGTLSPTLLWNLKINFPTCMPWWIMQDSFERLYALPHYNFSQALLLFSIILIIKFLRTNKIKYAYFSSLIIFIAGLILPSVLIPIITVLPISYVLYLFFLQTKQPKIPISKTDRPEITSDQVKMRYLEEDSGNLNKVGVSKKLGIEDANRWQDLQRVSLVNNIYPDRRILKGIGLLISVALTVYLIMKYQIQTGFPWNQWTKWGLNRWNFAQPDFDITFLLSFGILPLLSIPSILYAFRRNNWPLIFVSLWAIIPFLLLPFATPLEIAKIRLAEVANFVPFGILTAYTIFEIIPRLIASFAGGTIEGLQIKQPKMPFLSFSAGDASEGSQTSASPCLSAAYKRGFEDVFGIRKRQDPHRITEKLGIEDAINRILQFTFLIVFFLSTFPISFNILNQRIAYTKTEPIYDHIYIPKTSFEAIEFIKNKVPKDSKIISGEKYGIIIPAFAPTISYFGHVTQTQYYFEKEKNVTDFFSGRMKEKEAKEFLTINGLNYIYYGWQEKELGNVVSKYSFLKPVFQNRDVVILQVIENKL